MSELTKPEEMVKHYLEEQIKRDEALKTLYIPSKIKDCYKYITEQARKQAQSNSAWIDDAIVYKWARDYFLEELPKNATKEDMEEVAENIPAPEPEKKEPEFVEINGTKYDKDGNGLLFDL